jgi:hypothetical protein
MGWGFVTVMHTEAQPTAYARALGHDATDAHHRSASGVSSLFSSHICVLSSDDISRLLTEPFPNTDLPKRIPPVDTLRTLCPPAEPARLRAKQQSARPTKHQRRCGRESAGVHRVAVRE